MHRHHHGLLAGATLVLLLLAACGGSGSTSPSGNPSSSSAPASQSAEPSGSGSTAGLDSCVVGSWKTTGVSGSAKLSASVTLQLTGGGAGGVITVNQDGSFKEDYSGDTPWTATGSDGGTYQVAFAGSLVGTVTASQGQATLTISSGSNATQTISKDGASQGQIQAQPSTSHDTYTCTAGAALSVTGSDGITTNAVPA